MRITRENEYYHEVSLHGVVRLTRLPGAGLSQAATVDNPVAGHEIVLIVGSPSKVAKATLIEFATKLTAHTRVNQGWSGIHAIVEPMEFRTASAWRAKACRGRNYRLDCLNRVITSSLAPPAMKETRPLWGCYHGGCPLPASSWTVR